MISEEQERLEAMASGSETWDLSPNDIAAIQWALKQVSALAALRQRHAEVEAAYVAGCHDGQRNPAEFVSNLYGRWKSAAKAKARLT